MENTGYVQQMAKKNSSVVLFKNIDKEDFEHTYDGVPFPVKAGETIPLQYPVAKLLATHLARKILRRRKQSAANKKDDKGSMLNLYTPVEINELIGKIMTERIEQEQEPVLTPGQIEKKKAEELKEKYKDKLTPPPAATKPKVTKKEVIATLKERDVTFNPRSSLDELLALVAQSEKEVD